MTPVLSNAQLAELLARDSGAWISIGTDAHRPDELTHLDFGVAAAVAARFPPDRILNLLSPDELRRWAPGKRTSRSPRFGGNSPRVDKPAWTAPPTIARPRMAAGPPDD